MQIKTAIRLNILTTPVSTRTPRAVRQRMQQITWTRRKHPWRLKLKPSAKCFKFPSH